MKEEGNWAQHYLDIAAVILLVIGADQTIRLVNRKGCQVLGYPEEEIVGKNWFDHFLPQRIREEVKAVHDRLMAGEIEPVEYFENLVVTAEGEEKLIAWHNTVLRDEAGQILATLSSGEDITERRRMEEALRESEERLRQILEQMPYPAEVCSSDGTAVLVNQAFLKMFGVPSADLVVGHYNVFEDPLVMEVLGLREEIERVYAGEVVFLPRLVVPLEKIGSEFAVQQTGRILHEVTMFPVLGKSGRVRQVVTIWKDITEQVEAEEQRQRYAAELERSNQELQQFAYIVSHDLREPLRQVSSFARLLAEDYRGQLDARADEFIGFIVDGTERMQAMIQGVLAYSRVRTRGRPFLPIDAQAVLERAQENLRLIIEEKGAQVTHDALPMVLADAVQLEQVFQNLIENALKFCRRDPPRVHVSARQEETEWVFSIRDNGIGIDVAHADHLFSLFQRLHTREEYPGEGIGLAICRRILDRHAGRIWLESTPGEGTTVFFTLPRRGN